MATWHKVDRLHAGAKRLSGDRTNPALAALMTVRINLIRRVLSALSINLKVKLDDIPKSLHSST
jgi:hypothetical protein